MTIVYRSDWLLSSEHQNKKFLVEFLASSSANIVNAPNRKNKTAIQIAFENGDLDLAQILFPVAIGVQIYVEKLLSVIFLIKYLFLGYTTSDVFSGKHQV